MEKPSFSFFAMNFLLLFIVISLILIVFELRRFAFVFELMALLLFIFLFALSMFIIYRNKKWGWTVLGAILILLLVNTLLIIFVTGRFETTHLTVIVFSVIGLLIALLNLRKEKEATSAKQEDKAEDYYTFIDKMEPEESKQESHAKAEFSPGKYIASKKANKFHVAKCDWALRISKENQVWFNTKEDAQSKGFEADRCVA